MRMTVWAVLALLVVVSAGVTRAAQPDVAVLPAEVRGVVLFPDGETPVDDLRVRVWNAETEKVVYRTRTDEDGLFSVPKLDEGTHYVTVGPVRIDMRVLTARAGVQPQAHGFVIVVPKRMPLMRPFVPSSISAAAIVPQVMSP